MGDQGSIGQWRASNKELLDSVGQVRKAVAGPDAEKLDMANLQLGIGASYHINDIHPFI